MPPRSEFTTTALLAIDERDRQIVSVHAKLTYEILASGELRLADLQQPLLAPAPESEEPVRETDVLPVKTGTDLIILASAHAPTASTREMTARIAIDAARWEFAVSGKRTCSYSRPGRIKFSTPEPFEKIPLRYENAYGGFDARAPEPRVETLPDAFAPHPGMYPRNPVGRGYAVVESPGLDGLELPSVEHPGERLTPANLVAGAPENWWRQPIPWSCDWFDKTWYPRIAFFGAPPEHIPDDDRQMTEVKLGFVAAGQNERRARIKPEEAMDPRFTNAASPALVLPFLRGGESVVFEGMRPKGRLVVRLPARDRPRMSIRFEGRTHELAPVLHRVVISTEEMKAYTVWQGGWLTPRSLPDRFPREGEDARMELEGIETFVGGNAVDPLV
jgi:hypothetical protein